MIAAVSSTDASQPNRVRFIDIDAEDQGQRIDNFLLKTLKGVPKSKIYRILRKGEVRVNGGRVKPSQRLVSGDRLRIPPVRTAAPGQPVVLPAYLRAELEQRLLFEDEHLLVLNKPSGLAVHGGSGLSFGVIEALRELRPGVRGLELAHRLDKATSGCLLIAKKRSALRVIQEQFRRREVRKQYFALVHGRWKGGKRLVEVPLQKNLLSSGERMVRVSADGKASATRLRPITNWGDVSLLEACPQTGRTHQIRVHAQYCGHPIVGDEKYGGDHAMGSMPLPKRLFLHARSISIVHPQSNERVSFYAPLDAEWIDLLVRLDA
ncbi:MAG TPA: 23S rRNA pseudouridine(955/2504/2580) synthase RluC [Chromatiaceae bacterium]|jgi:23S rRNA pseudouridine955/2504/2580 synthase|nr:23S rRNA pseudouridine(955/2504/2580) synthase RluC [Chromatiaceae bacterium]HIA08103.1 23S rRNA pseudouridine(955/2504/2580) synthase RluC [Chromatiaceae bacterium]HIO54217.1 23S rRNA pseudouridine(955/2504/2580) synthase RluC [Chromatiales bacterium]